ncbi:hypothetical protein [Falsiroseomonas sp. CW058]|uniref:hypothetical protein n=1 Tax=Falsiroseomonas sp. CW058 TaxID=3388664 RepID=UPI003D32018C
MSDVKFYVYTMSGKKTGVKRLGFEKPTFLEQIGFVYDQEFDAWIKVVDSDFEKAELADFLRNNNVAFSDGREWNPAEMFQYFRDDKKFLEGNFKRISWSGPGKYSICDV